MLTDLIQVIDCLTPEQTQRCLDLLDTYEWTPTTVFGMSGCEVNPNIRLNDRVCLNDTDECAKIMHEGMNAALLTYKDIVGGINGEFQKYPIPGTYRTNCFRESIQVLRYTEGQYYKWHSDEATDRKLNEANRTISIVLYLTDDFGGGRTHFIHRHYKPKAGQALVFPSNWCFPHECEVITKGTKIAAVTWYHSHYNFN